MTKPRLSKDLSFLILATQLKWDEKSKLKINELFSFPINWSNITFLSELLGLNAFIYEFLIKNNLESLVPKIFFLKFQKAYQRQGLETIFLKRQIKDIQEIFTQKKIKFCFLKGAELLDRIYITPIRPMSDIDILCKPEDLKTIQDCLKNLGYYQKTMHQSQELASLSTIQKHFPPFFHEKRHTVEIHFNLFSGLLLDENLTKEAWNTAIPVRESEQFNLSKEYHLLFMCNHLAYHILSPREGLVLYWFCDISEWIKKYNKKIDWSFFSELEHSELKDRVFSVLNLIKKEWSPPIPSALFENYKDSKDWSLNIILEKITGNDDGLKRKRRIFRYYWQIWFNKTPQWSYKDRINYWLRLLFPQTSYIKDRYKIKNKLIIKFIQIFHPLFIFHRAVKRLTIK